MTDTANMMLTLADAIENGHPNDIDGTLVLDPEQCSLIVQSLRNNAATMRADHDGVQIDEDRLVNHVEAALEVG
ncbi:MAG: hypothetical protein ACJ8E2_01415 [Bradyrhizobium sp.]